MAYYFEVSYQHSVDVYFGIQKFTDREFETYPGVVNIFFLLTEVFAAI